MECALRTCFLLRYFDDQIVFIVEVAERTSFCLRMQLEDLRVGKFLDELLDGSRIQAEFSRDCFDSQEEQDPVSSMQNTGLTNHSSFLVFSVYFRPFSIR